MNWNYFGTDTREVGHYLREITPTGINYEKSIALSELPFDPYDYPSEHGRRNAPKGYVGFYQKGGYSICAISGSCIDTRGGCHSVFFFKGDMSKHELIDKIKSLPYAMDIINKMPFHVEYFKENNQVS